MDQSNMDDSTFNDLLNPETFDPALFSLSPDLFSSPQPQPSTLQQSDCARCIFDRNHDDEVAHWKHCNPIRTSTRSTISTYLSIRNDLERRFKDTNEPIFASTLHFLISLWQKGEISGESDAALCLDSESDESMTSGNVHLPLLNMIHQILSDTPNQMAAKMAFEDVARGMGPSQYGQIPSSGPHRGDSWSEEEIEWLKRRVEKHPSSAEKIAHDFDSWFEKRLGGTRDPVSVLLKIDSLKGVERQPLRPMGLPPQIQGFLKGLVAQQLSDEDILAQYRQLAISKNFRLRSKQLILDFARECRAEQASRAQEIPREIDEFLYGLALLEWDDEKILARYHQERNKWTVILSDLDVVKRLKSLRAIFASSS